MEKLISSKIVFECPVFKVEEAEIELPNGVREPRWYVVKRNAVGIIPLDSDGRILLTREYRSAAGEVRWRIPAGGVRDDETPEDAAHRELREEVGLDCKKLDLILDRSSPSGMIKQRTFFYLASELFASPLKSGEWEQIEIIPKRLDEVGQLLGTGEIEGNIAAALMLVLKRLKPR
jgi:8-oxo-dGTP pyrophosphatase MutT (NUDIX family)